MISILDFNTTAQIKKFCQLPCYSQDIHVAANVKSQLMYTLARRPANVSVEHIDTF